MSLFSDFTPELEKLVKNCKSKEEMETLLKNYNELAPEELAMVSGGNSEPDIEPERCYDGYGDTCKDVKTENVSSDFATGKITGADFFA